MSALTIIKYPGGKAQHVGRMMRYAPPFAPRVIVDAFCGSCAFGVAAAELFPEARLALNDTNQDLVNALLQIRDHADELAEMLRLTPYSRALFVGLRAQSPPLAGAEGHGSGGEGLTAGEGLARARDWIVRNRQSVGGCLSHSGTGWSRDQEGRKVAQWAKLPDQLREFAARMIGRSYIECQDFEELLFGAKGQVFGWDAPDAWVYLDPPYPGREQYYGMGPMNGAPTSEGFHERVARVANACQGAVLVSYADTPEFERYIGMYPSWRIERFEAVQHMRVRRDGRSKGTRTELLLMNYEPHAAQRRLRLITQEAEMSETAACAMMDPRNGPMPEEDEEIERLPDDTVCGITDPIAEIDAIGYEIVRLAGEIGGCKAFDGDGVTALVGALRRAAERVFLVGEELAGCVGAASEAMEQADADVAAGVVRDPDGVDHEDCDVDTGALADAVASMGVGEEDGEDN